MKNKWRRVTELVVKVKRMDLKGNDELQDAADENEANQKPVPILNPHCTSESKTVGPDDLALPLESPSANRVYFRVRKELYEAMSTTGARLRVKPRPAMG